MLKRFAVPAGALVLATLLSASANAADKVVGYLSNVVGPTDTEVSYKLTMPKFNPALGTLTGVKIYFYASEQVSTLKLTNISSTTSQSFGAAAAVNFIGTMTNSATAGDRYSALQQTLAYFDTGISSAIGSCSNVGPVVKPNQCSTLTYGPGESHDYAPFTFANTDAVYVSDPNSILVKGTGVAGLTGLIRNGTTIANYVGAGTWTLSGGPTVNLLSLNGAGGNIRFDQTTKASFQAEVDYTYTPGTGKIGDFVWQDTNHNGVQDAGEPGIPGVTVLLKQNGNLVLSTTTGASGDYLFSELAAGTYTVEVDPSTLPAGYTATLSAQGDISKDSNGSPATVVLGAGETNLTIDLGYWKPGRIGDYVWQDTNHNGVQDAGEPGIAGVTVSLKQNGNLLLSTVTGANGDYAFTDLAAGTYSVEVDATTLPSGFTATTSGQGGDSAKDSNGSPATVTIAFGETNLTIDFGYWKPGKIGDLVWDDVNGNGVQDAGELGIPGVTVRLKQNGTTLKSTTTGTNGDYSFTDLAAGTYTVEVDAASVPAGYTATLSVQGGDSTKDSDGSPATVTIGFGETNVTIDFGYLRPGKIGDFVWQDTNHNGKQDDGDTGIDGVRVELCADSACSTLLGFTLTGTSPNGKPGYYQFSSLAPGTYYVRIPSGQSVLASFIPTFLGQGTSVEDSNPNPAAVVLTFAQPSDQTIDFGFTPPGDAKIGDYVWSDLNHNGMQDAGEPGIGGVKLKLGRNADCSTLEAVATTAPDGSYLFTGLFGGTYYICVDGTTVPANYTATAVNVGSTDKDSNNHASAVVTVADHGSDLTIDFGYVPPAVGTIGNFVWRDVNRNGTQDSGEPGINGVKVQLYDSQNQLIRTTYTANANGTDGFYQFTGLQADTYRVQVDTTTLPAGYFATQSNIGGAAVDSNGNPGTVTLPTNSSSDDTIDFGYQSPCAGSIGDLVWNDSNANGIQDAGELGIPGVTVTLRAADNTFIASSTTDANGRYSFGGLCAATYRVEVTTPPGYTPSVSNAGDPTKDSNGSPAVVILPADATDNTIDFGYNIPSSGGALTTFTQGGWGAKPAGSNPGMLLKNNFSAVFPSGVVIGGGKTLKFTSQTAVQNFLPAGGTAAALNASAVDATKSSAGVFAGQVLALQLSVSFSNAGITKAGLATKRVKSGVMAGRTVAEVLAMANAALGGATTSVSISDLNAVVDAINNNYDNGTVDKGYLQ